ncbi:hypothetical protein GCM10023201_50400 [Actinomycetospora corticicola]
MAPMSCFCKTLGVPCTHDFSPKFITAQERRRREEEAMERIRNMTSPETGQAEAGDPLPSDD